MTGLSGHSRAGTAFPLPPCPPSWACMPLCYPEMCGKRFHLAGLWGRNGGGVPGLSPPLPRSQFLPPRRCPDETYRAASCSGCERPTSPPDDSDSSAAALPPAPRSTTPGRLAAAAQRPPTIASPGASSSQPGTPPAESATQAAWRVAGGGAGRTYQVADRKGGRRGRRPGGGWGGWLSSARLTPRPRSEAGGGGRGRARVLSPSGGAERARGRNPRRNPRGRAQAVPKAEFGGEKAKLS